MEQHTLPGADHIAGAPYICCFLNGASICLKIYCLIYPPLFISLF